MANHLAHPNEVNRTCSEIIGKKVARATMRVFYRPTIQEKSDRDVHRGYRGQGLLLLGMLGDRTRPRSMIYA